MLKTFRKGLPKKFRDIIFTIGLIILIGTLGFKLVGGEDKSFLDALYMTAITLTTVGYGDMVGADKTVAGKVFTIVFVFVGAGAIAYLFTTLTAYIIEGELRRVFRRRSMEKRIEKMKNHYIVCGVGMVGLYAIHELYLTRRPTVAIDVDESKMEVLKHQNISIDMVVGDAAENEVLWKAGIEKAKGLFATTNSDNDNIVIILTARQMNPEIRIVGRCNDTKNIDKLRRAGSDTVVALNYIGGLRMASEMIRPAVTGFLDKMLRDKESPVRVDEVVVPKHSPLVGKPLRAIDFKAVGNPLLISIQKHQGDFTYNPDRETVLEEQMSLILLSTAEEREKIQALLSPHHGHHKE
jgi:voltage-gated potassium channel